MEDMNIETYILQHAFELKFHESRDDYFEFFRNKLENSYIRCKLISGAREIEEHGKIKKVTINPIDTRSIAIYIIMDNGDEGYIHVYEPIVISKKPFEKIIKFDSEDDPFGEDAEWHWGEIKESNHTIENFTIGDIVRLDRNTKEYKELYPHRRYFYEVGEDEFGVVERVLYNENFIIVKWGSGYSNAYRSNELIIDIKKEKRKQNLEDDPWNEEDWGYEEIKEKNHMKNFRMFINENYTLTIADGESDSEAVWLEECDVSDIWSDYKSEKINENNFINTYNRRLVGKKDKLVKIGVKCWNELAKLIREGNDDMMKYLDDIYDWADKYGVKIISKKND